MLLPNRLAYFASRCSNSSKVPLPLKLWLRLRMMRSYSCFAMR